MRVDQADVVIVGAGPAGSVAAALLRKAQRKVIVLEKERFPRFSIGESLLSQSMEYLESAGMLREVVEAGFQYKNGAAFVRAEQTTEFDFREKFGAGWATTYQVQRADFDHVLAKSAQRQGADVRFCHEVTAIDLSGVPHLTVQSDAGETYLCQAKYVLDASGFGRILPRLLDLSVPSNFPARGAIFTHISDGTAPGAFDRSKILITVHPKHKDVWFWLIPFSNGRCSLGVVAKLEYLQQYLGDETTRLRGIIAEVPTLHGLLANATWDTPARQIVGYAANVSRLCGKGFALLGNAGEFLDPVFSSGVTIAFKSADLAVKCIEREYAGEAVDWQSDYANALKAGVDTFRCFVESWYAGKFQDIIFHPEPSPEVRRMICAILAGYAWDQNNPYVRDSKRRLATLEQLCATAD